MAADTRDLIDELEASLSARDRTLGAHYTSPAVAARVAELAAVGRGPVVDPACGGGALLLAAADRLVAAGHPREVVARDLLWGADIDARAVAVTEQVITMWSGGTAPMPGHVVVADTLALGRAAWTAPPRFDAVVGNPPFQGQLASDTARSREVQCRLRDRYGAAVVAYVDTAALFLLVGVELAGPGARVAMIQPQSTIASRDAGPVRAALCDSAALVDLWAPVGQLFDAKVHVCVPVLEVGTTGDADWSRHLAAVRGVPPVEFDAAGTIGAMAEAVAGFRQHYYALVDHVRESDGDDAGALVTSGAIDIGTCRWGEHPTRFAKQRWVRPVVDLDRVRLVGGWVDAVRRPKVLVASQTRVVEAVADRLGAWVPVTPVVSVIPHDAAQVDLVTAALCAPPVAAWAATRAAGTGLSATAIRMSAALALAAPLPRDHTAWEEASEALVAGDLDRFAERATVMHGLPDGTSEAILGWWWANSRVGPRAVAR